jgi:hypothetical protein
MRRYWDGDGAWLAVDTHGHVAIFTTAGVAPIPTIVLDMYPAASPEDSVNEMPVIGGYDLRVRCPRPDDYAGFAARGLFAYDWQDVHRTIDFSRGYDLIAVPIVPVLTSELPPELSRLARLVTFGLVPFEQAFTLPVEQLLACEAG